MPIIACIVEGEGDELSVPLYRVVHRAETFYGYCLHCA